MTTWRRAPGRGGGRRWAARAGFVFIAAPSLVLLRSGPANGSVAYGSPDPHLIQGVDRAQRRGGQRDQGPGPFGLEAPKRDPDREEGEHARVAVAVLEDERPGEDGGGRPAQGGER